MHEGYIFCINAGHSGSKYLANLLNSSEECVAFHEAYPNFAGDPIKLVNTEGPENTLSFQKIKTDYIIKTKIHKPIYADTSHIFIKAWCLAAIRYMRNVKVIWLRRNHNQTLRAFLRRDSIPDKSPKTKNWYLRTNYNFNLIKPSFDPTDIQKCDWYLKEIEARAICFKKQFPNIPFFEVWLEDLNSKEFVYSFFDDLELHPTKKTDVIIGKVVNSKPDVLDPFFSKIINSNFQSMSKFNHFVKNIELHVF